MSAAVVGVKRSIQESNFTRKKSRCGPARYDAAVLASIHPQSDFSSREGDTLANRAKGDLMSCSLPPEAENGLPSTAEDISKRYPRVPIAIIHSILEITKVDMAATCQMIDNLTEAATGCRWAVDLDPSPRSEMQNPTKPGHVSGIHDPPGQTPMEEVAPLHSSGSCGTIDDLRAWAHRIVLTLQGSNSVEEAMDRVAPLLSELKREVEAASSTSSDALAHEVTALRHSQQLCSRALRVQHEKLQAIMAKYSSKAESEKEMSASLEAAKEENCKLRRMNEELQFFLSSANNASSEYMFSSRQPDVY